MFTAEITLPKAAELDQHIEGQIPLTDFPRLGELLTKENQGDAVFQMNFSLDREKRVLVKGDVKATLKLICQRCLQSYAHAIHSEFSLVAVDDLAGAVQLDKRYEAVLLRDHKLQVAEVLEDELLLDFPIVPKHPVGECEVLLEAHSEESQSNHPFSSLEQFKKNRSN